MADEANYLIPLGRDIPQHAHIYRCLRCKVDRPVKEVEIVKTSNNRYRIRAKCTICEAQISKFIKKFDGIDEIAVGADGEAVHEPSAHPDQDTDTSGGRYDLDEDVLVIET